MQNHPNLIKKMVNIIYKKINDLLYFQELKQHFGT